MPGRFNAACQFDNDVCIKVGPKARGIRGKNGSGDMYVAGPADVAHDNVPQFQLQAGSLGQGRRFGQKDARNLRSNRSATNDADSN